MAWLSCKWQINFIYGYFYGRSILVTLTVNVVTNNALTTIGDKGVYTGLFPLLQESMPLLSLAMTSEVRTISESPTHDVIHEGEDQGATAQGEVTGSDV